MHDEFNKPKEAGKLIGEGKTRLVYEYLPDPKYVIKVELDQIGINDREYRTYQMFKQFGYDHLLCPCVKVNDLHLMEKASQNFPPGIYEVAIFSSKIKNWGMIDNKIKRLDYSWDTFSENNNWYVRFLKSDVEKYTVKFDWFSTFVFDRGEEWHCYIQYNERCFDFMYKNLRSTLVVHG